MSLCAVNWHLYVEVCLIYLCLDSISISQTVVYRPLVVREAVQAVR